MDYATALGNLAAADERMVVLTAENRVPVRGLPERLGARFVDVGIAEQTLVGMSAGLALRGRIPVAHALAAFLTMRAFEFIRTDVGLPGLPVKLVGYVPGVLSTANGPTHQALEDVALMRGIPGLRVFCPADVEDLVLGLDAVVADAAPWYIRYVDRPAPIRHSAFEIGRAEVVRMGTDVALLVAGALLREASDAATRLAATGLSVRLVNMRTLRPIDEECVVTTAQTARLIVTVEDHFRTGGLYSTVAEILARRRLRTPLDAVCLEDRWFAPALLDRVLDNERLSGSHIASRVTAAMERTDVH
ncbi:MAG TPA: transketolase C-terminal domain-containing protein [Gemmatimonadales bacterium]|nr:transketolase C-terminal domain-containing protein [Gemmatimonadales bacterium]